MVVFTDRSGPEHGRAINKSIVYVPKTNITAVLSSVVSFWRQFITLFFFKQNPSQLLQGSMDKTIKLNLERLPDIPSNHAKGHVISDSFSEVLWSQAREAAGLDVAHRQTSSSLANLGV